MFQMRNSRRVLSVAGVYARFRGHKAAVFLSSLFVDPSQLWYESACLFEYYSSACIALIRLTKQEMNSLSPFRSASNRRPVWTKLLLTEENSSPLSAHNGFPSLESRHTCLFKNSSVLLGRTYAQIFRIPI